MAFNRFDDMGKMFDDMNRMFDQMRTNWATSEYMGRYDDEGRMPWSGRMDRNTMTFTEEDDCLVFVMDMPGFEKSDIECSYDDGMLRISAERDAEESSENVWMRSSRRMSEQVRVPGDIVTDDISATYRNGVLEVHMPRREAEIESGRSIDIQ
ncbi:Hsp20/alpha crystallin family protein [Haloarchaeobius sp. TZWWS8]|uniref:Hsp20/alpha crystallin family protein n=1 Tax=Haloarchaeobius sp. TZWWS8 TaxID=3446121 RepID=UPI003EC0D81F